jgi:hypothetical protein
MVGANPRAAALLVSARLARAAHARAPAHPPPVRPNPQDAPRHFLPGGAGIDALPLGALVGPAHVIEVAADANVTAAVLDGLDVPPGAQRLLFRTLNTRRGLMGHTPFVTDFVGLDSSAARWAAARGVRLVGMDYLTIGMMDDIVATHKELMQQVGRGPWPAGAATRGDGKLPAVLARSSPSAVPGVTTPLAQPQSRLEVPTPMPIRLPMLLLLARARAPPMRRAS